jgi:hypothetical protein
LGITINFNERHKVKFTMIDYLEDILSEMPSDMEGVARTPAQDDLFTIDEQSPLLNERDADFYHRTTARLLFAAKRARPDLQVAVAYMCTRVKAPTVSDYHKLGRTIKYLRGTIFMPLVLGWDGSGVGVFPPVLEAISYYARYLALGKLLRIEMENYHIIMTMGMYRIKPPWVSICLIHTY